jgi:hypothetical protein
LVPERAITSGSAGCVSSEVSRKAGRPKPEVVEAFAAAVGQTAEGVVTGYFEDEKGQAVTIDVQSPIPATNKILHITLATAEGVKPVYSNQLVANPAARQEVKPLKLTGVYDYFPRTVPNP